MTTLTEAPSESGTVLKVLLDSFDQKLSDLMSNATGDWVRTWDVADMLLDARTDLHKAHENAISTAI